MKEFDHVSVDVPEEKQQEDVAEAIKNCPLKAAPGYVVILPKAAEVKSPGGIVLPQTAQQKTFEGVVMNHAKGPRQFGNFDVFDFQPGEFVIYGRYSGKPYQVGEVEYMILPEEEIVATIPGEGK